MPLVNPKPSDVKPLVPASGRAQPVEMHSALVQTRFTPMAALAMFTEGSTIVCTYYRQLVDIDDNLMAQQVNRKAPYQQYEKIIGLEMKQQGDLNFSQDEQTKDVTITGTAIMFGGVIPNKGDMFRADLGDGQAGLFTLLNSERLSVRKESQYRVDFQVVSDDKDTERLEDLEAKVVDTLYFVKDFLNAGKNPLLIDAEYNAYVQLRRVFATMVNEYLRTFFSETCQTLIVPDQAQVTYDHFLTKAVLSLLETTNNPMMRKVTLHNVEQDYGFRTTTVWDSILQVEPSHLWAAAQRMEVRGAELTYNLPAFSGVFWAKIDRLIYPIDRRTDADRILAPSQPASHSVLTLSGAPVDDFQRLISKRNLTVAEQGLPEPIAPTPHIHRITDDEYYVFSRAFYEQDSVRQSQLERLVWSMLNQEDPDVTILYELVLESQKWDNLERFYYVPVLIALTVLVLRGPNF